MSFLYEHKYQTIGGTKDQLVTGDGTLTDKASVGAVTSVNGQTGAVTISTDWVTPPALSTDSGTSGDIAYDSDYLYICISTDTWKRVALSTW